MKTLLLVTLLAGACVLHAADAVKPVLPALDAQDQQLLQQIINDPAMDQLQTEVQATQKLLQAQTDALHAKQELQQLKLAILATTQFPEKYKLQGYTYDLQKQSWVKKPEPPVESKKPEGK